MLAGALGGVLMGRVYLGARLDSGAHALGALLLPFIAFGLGSGLWMQRRPKPRRWLPALHGLANLLVLLLALAQATSGHRLLETIARDGV